jgi:hypothetical protein
MRNVNVKENERKRNGCNEISIRNNINNNETWRIMKYGSEMAIEKAKWHQYHRRNGGVMQ